MAILIFFCFISFIAPLSSSLEHHSHLTKQSLRQNTTSSQQYLEITRPLPFANLTPSCTFHILTHNFSNTIGLPPVSVLYSPPSNCSWTHVVLQFNASSKGFQYDRIAAVWLDGAELLRTSTPEPTDNGVFWSVTKDVTRYSSILVNSNKSLSVMLENLVNDIYTGVYQVNVSFLYYDVKPVDNPIEMGANNLKSSYEKPADLIIPITSGNGSQGFWFRFLNESELHGQKVIIPNNTYKAVIEIYVSSHGYDEFWYSNPPDSYIQNNSLTTRRGHGSYREVLLNIDENLVGSVVPFPVIFTGGINPLYWEPLVSIGAFDLPSYDIDLTSFLGLLLDGQDHFFGLGVADGIPFWLVDANLHLWLDNNEVQAKAFDLGTPKFKIERSSSFIGLDGSFEVELKRKSQISSWVNSSAGNLTTIVSRELKFKNKINFYLNGTEKHIKQKVEEEIEVRVLSISGSTISKTKVKRKYPLTITSKTLPSTENGTSLMLSDLDHEWKEKKKSDGGSSNTLTNRQQCNGWMVVQDHNVLYGGATTQQSYSYEGEAGCYSRSITAANGMLMNDTANSLCAAPLKFGSFSAL
ncbi:peptide-N4-(N-acetyl-beta-glucosaminyl)asparagine amidase A-like [Nicotiana tabacum]|uniref:Peptide-N4-(N-acetyl-beta- glucosaminyl)asparagine amidase A-like n=1 Tax=Nicotiana tabacum TaxID=4097 RepID=A0A1S3ZFC5_TOBAC|nr:PREDICTED: peptide-N4-(N-acetyl-beta-glucosaminyl)asparagine amidase A-like [Nicotiana tabacum]XP_033513950.1 peptide-N4-(N-acetyl-beta-glucosaminyl)asparagine amidase A [Nicotiana tomentosiformis]